MRALGIEWYKTRRRGFWLLTLAMSAMVFLWMSIGLRDMTEAEKAQGYAYCLYQAPILSSIVMPVMIAVMVSRQCDMEHKGSAMKELFTMQTRRSLFGAKLVCAGTYLLAAVLLQAGSFLVLGRVYGFTEALPVGNMLLFVLSQWLVSLFLALVIQVLAINYVNQFIPMAAGLIAGLLGLMALFFSPVVMRLVPSAYYGLLSTTRMNWDPASRDIEMYYVGFSAADCAVLFVLGLVIFIAAMRRFSRVEV